MSTETRFVMARHIVRDPNAYDLRPAEIASISAALSEVDRLRADVQRLTEAFAHHHVAKYEDGKLTDQCAQCGLDLRNPVHIRVSR